MLATPSRWMPPSRAGAGGPSHAAAVAELTAAGASLTGVRLQITGSVPRGSGLSSSAALEGALCLALLGIAGAEVPEPIALAHICSRVENEWVGAQTGLLDQIASLCGRSDHALQIDFDTLVVTPVALDLRKHTLVTLDSGQSHVNAGGTEGVDGYNRRREECTEACEALGIDSLRSATLDVIARAARSAAGPRAARRHRE